MVPKLFQKREKNMLHYICLSMSSSLRIPTLSLPACNHCSQQKTQTISFLVAHLPQPLFCFGIFPLLCTCKSPETCIFYLSFSLEMKGASMDRLEATVYIFACFFSPLSFCLFPLLASLLLSLSLSSVCALSSRSGYFTIFCGASVPVHHLWLDFLSWGVERGEADPRVPFKHV